MPLLGTEHTNLPCGVLLFNIDEDCSNTYTRPRSSLSYTTIPRRPAPY